jgi:hypothetical protein
MGRWILPLLGFSPPLSNDHTVSYDYASKGVTTFMTQGFVAQLDRMVDENNVFARYAIIAPGFHFFP